MTKVLDINARQEVRRLVGHTGIVYSTALIWETATGTVVRVLRGHGAAVWGIAFSPDGRFVLTSSPDHTATCGTPIIATSWSRSARV